MKDVKIDSKDVYIIHNGKNYRLDKVMNDILKFSESNIQETIDNQLIEFERDIQLKIDNIEMNIGQIKLKFE
jgi:hypothetical protein